MAAGGPDYFGEEHLSAQLLTFLRRRGVNEHDGHVQCDLLKLADYSLMPAPLATMNPAGCIEKTHEEGSAGDGEPVAAGVEELPPPEEAEQQIQQLAAVLDKDELPPPRASWCPSPEGGASGGCISRGAAGGFPVSTSGNS